jgi:hypothetical protein
MVLEVISDLRDPMEDINVQIAQQESELLVCCAWASASVVSM